MVKKIRSLVQDKNLVNERRQQIASAALKVFLTKGYEITGMRDIMKASKMSSGGIYNYIGSKNDILHLIVLNTVMDPLLVSDYIKQFDNNSSTVVLSNAITGYFQNVDSISKQILLFYRYLRTFSQKDVDRIIASQIHEVTFFEQLIKEGIKREEFKCDNPTLLANDIVTIGHSWVLRQRYLHQNFTLEEYTKYHIRMVLDLLRVKKD